MTFLNRGLHYKIIKIIFCLLVHTGMNIKMLLALQTNTSIRQPSLGGIGFKYLNVTGTPFLYYIKRNR